MVTIASRCSPGPALRGESAAAGSLLLRIGQHVAPAGPPETASPLAVDLFLHRHLSVVRCDAEWGRAGLSSTSTQSRHDSHTTRNRLPPVNSPVCKIHSSALVCSKNSRSFRSTMAGPPTLCAAPRCASTARCSSRLHSVGHARHRWRREDGFWPRTSRKHRAALNVAQDARPAHPSPLPHRQTHMAYVVPKVRDGLKYSGRWRGPRSTSAVRIEPGRRQRATQALGQMCAKRARTQQPDRQFVPPRGNCLDAAGPAHWSQKIPHCSTTSGHTVARPGRAQHLRRELVATRRAARPNRSVRG